MTQFCTYFPLPYIAGALSSVAPMSKMCVNFNSTKMRVIYQLDAIFAYFSSKCFGLTRPSSGATEL